MWAATIDAGTSNTRVQAWYRAADEAWLPVARSQRPVGVRDTALSGSNLALRQAVAEALQQAALLADQHAQRHGWPGVAGPAGFDLVLASGMITSNLGLYELPHVWAPADAECLAQAMRCVRIEGIEPPIWCTPGVKNAVAPELLALDQAAPSCEQAPQIHQVHQAHQALMALDVMRGEEVEALALLEHLQNTGPVVLVLPGSHTKLVMCDGRRLVRCRTTLAGEMLAALTGHTVLRAAVDGQMATPMQPHWLEHGAALCRRDGLARAAFHVRALRLARSWLAEQADGWLGPDLSIDPDAQACANVLLGAVIADDLRTLDAERAALGGTAAAPVRVVVAGAGVLAQAWTHLAQQGLGAHCEVRWIVTGEAASEPTLQALSGAGALLLAQTRQRCLR